MDDSQTTAILLIAGDPSDAWLIAARLADTPGSSLERVDRLADALRRLAEAPFHVILLDLGVAEGQGLATLDAVLAAAGERPVIALTEGSDDATGDQAIQRGAADFLCKDDLAPQRLRRAVRYALARARLRQESARALALNDRRLQILLDLLQAPVQDLGAFLDTSLEAALALTDSPIGYLYNYDEDTEEFTLHAWSEAVMDACRVMAPQTRYALAKTGLWGEVVRQRRPLLVNAYDSAHPHERGHPVGHAPLTRFLSIPVFADGRIEAVLGVGNKEAPYTETDLLQLTLLMEGAWRAVGRLQAEEAQRATANQLVQAQKNEIVGRLSGGIAHEFNNFLSVVLICSEFARAEPGLSPSVREDLDEIHRAGERAASVVRQIQAFTRHEVAEVGPVDLNVVMSDIEHLLRGLVGDDVHVETRLAPNLWPVLADRVMVEQAILNLAINARDAMPGGGHLTIATCNSVLDAAAARSSDVEPGDYVRVTVSDGGVGMDEDTLGRIFEPFFTTKEVGRGAGLGLATVRSVVTSCGGFLDVRSTPGVGSVFEMSFPRVAVDAATQAQLLARLPSGVVPAGTRVLLVEDDPSVLATTVRALRSAGYEVTAVDRSADALAASGAAAKRFDALVTDVVLPFMSGPELARRVRLRNPGIAVLFISGHGDSAFAEHGLDARTSELLLKPFEAGALLSRLQTLLERSTRRSERAGQPGQPAAIPDATASAGIAERVDAGQAKRLSEALVRARLDAAMGMIGALAVDAPLAAAAIRERLSLFDYDGAAAILERVEVSEREERA